MRCVNGCRTTACVALWVLFCLDGGAVWSGEEIGGVRVTPDVVYGHKLGMALTMDVLQPKEANGAGVLFMVSGGWVSRWMPAGTEVAFLRPLLKRGFTVFAVRHGSSPRFKVPEAVADVRRAVRYVRMTAARWEGDPARWGVGGFSAGGHLALMLGTTGDDGDPQAKDPVLRHGSRVAAVVAYFPPTDLRPYTKLDSPYRKQFPALAFEPERAKDYSPLLQVTSDDAPSLVVHGDQDSLVPLWHSEKIEAALKGQHVPVRLMVIHGAGHGFSGEGAERAAKAWGDWFERYLLRPSPQTESK